MMERKQFERGSSLSIFTSDRREDWTALVFAFTIAVVVLFVAG